MLTALKMADEASRNSQNVHRAMLIDARKNCSTLSTIPIAGDHCSAASSQGGMASANCSAVDLHKFLMSCTRMSIVGSTTSSLLSHDRHLFRHFGGNKDAYPLMLRTTDSSFAATSLHTYMLPTCAVYRLYKLMSMYLGALTPPVPRAFEWRCPQGAEVLNSVSCYGTL